MIKIKVPATSANIGPGFDCLGISLKLFNEIKVKEIDKGLVIKGGEKKFRNKFNLIYTSMIKCFDIVRYKPKGIEINLDPKIPISRGLGSSASCIVSGVMAANEISNSKLSKEDILNISTNIEGHPDNITPAIYGGLTVSILEKNKVYFNKIDIKKGLKFLAIIPDFKLSTKESRNVLPENIKYSDGVFNVGRVSLLISSLVNGRFDLLKLACKDKLHQNYRGKLISNYEKIIDYCDKSETKGVYLSGAGPTIMVILNSKNNIFKNDIVKFLNSLNMKCLVKELEIDTKGAKVS
ncbi:MAG: homoserine kinase [Firmicutes bacterium]|nr:homoserine kinase [Bacillota bacterium]